MEENFYVMSTRINFQEGWIGAYNICRWTYDIHNEQGKNWLQIENSMLEAQQMLWFLHASNASPDTARTTICLLDDEYESYYC